MACHPLRFAVVGLGAFGETYLECLRSLRTILDVDVTAVCSGSADRAREIADRFGVPRRYTDVEAVASDPDVDVVCVVTAEQHHRLPTLAALAGGKDVIVEKPLATRLDHVHEMIAASNASGRRLLVGQILRFETAYRSLAHQVHSGEIGRVVSLQTRRNRPALAVERYRRTHPVFETGILDIDVMIWLTQSRVHQVRAFTRTINPGPTPDLVWGILEFDSGAVGMLETTWLAPDRGRLFADDAINVIGTRGSARVDLSRSPLSVWNEHGHQLPDVFYEPRVDGWVGGALREQLISFTCCLRDRTMSPRVSMSDVRHGVAVAQALVKSAEENRDRTVTDIEGL